MIALALVSYLLIDAGGAVRAADWPGADRPQPMGSLVKPFTALAYAQRHRMQYPIHECRGDGCWLKSGHGRIGISAAVAQSCNSYFRALAADLLPSDVAAIAARFGLRGPDSNCPREALYGMGDGWPVAPLDLARAYLEMAVRRGEPGIAELIEGMALSARTGTAAAIGRGLAKTGTAPCLHSPREAGDGYVVVLYPADAPRFVLLVEAHGVPGREAAAIASKLMEEF
jgi:cell division protein FtsI/penicillin-binding protein 2